ncbi:MAG: transketolase [Victivallales bacterium]|nr:transketolase [Victivallales bacterium]MCF7889023.1 transketolase [Victivallales bacterium]
MDSILKIASDNIRILSAEAVQKAKSGHPGMPMGCADFAFTLWYKYMRHNPANPEWLGRDRFVLSAGHGSMLLYSLLYLFEYGMKLEDIKQFRQWQSLTPGHPEYKHTTGVEVTTGPLGSGFATGVGMSIASKQFAAEIGLNNSELFNKQKVYTLCSDGCMMEGTTHEAASLAGHLKLDNLICLYDSNNITIEGDTSLAFTENVGMRYEAYGWRVITIENANSISQVEKGLEKALQSDGRPTFVICKTQIGFGSPNKVNKNSAHGEPLGEEELAATKKRLGFPETPFYINEEVKELCSKRVKELKAEAAVWDNEFNKFLETKPEKAENISKRLHKSIPGNLLEELLKTAPTDEPAASRASAGAILQKASELVPALMGGAADLAPSTKTLVKTQSDFTPENLSGKNFHFGVRELGMGFLINGMSLYGGVIPYAATFTVFSDYMKPALRLAAIQKLNLVYCFTHDSIFVGEDGPTHQPIEQIAMLRSIPGMTVIRPADANEAAHAWNSALRIEGPVAMLLTRQKLDPVPPELKDKIDVAKGAYILSDDKNFDILIIATGSEVNLGLKAAELLRKEGKRIRVVSMPSRELFLAQEKDYQVSVIPENFKNIVSLELGTTFGWEKFIGKSGLAIGLNHFGDSAPYKKLSDEYGFTPEKIVSRINNVFNDLNK